MTVKSCGCATETCGCCEGTQAVVPVPIYNRPGLDAIDYRVGTHGAFLETMKARLANMPVTAPAADGQSLQTFFPLAGLTTRDPSDPAIAFLDAWSTVGDVLTFYQERIANEGYLRTATERRSVLELARLVGYTLRPGVASTVYLAYTLEDKQLVPVVIAPGARSQSIPGPGELPQFFETSDKLDARHEWNNLQVRLTKPQQVTLLESLGLTQLYLAGTTTNLKAGDSLMLAFAEKDKPMYVVRKIASVEGQFEEKRTLVRFQVLDAHIVAAMKALRTFILAISGIAAEAHNLGYADNFLTQVRLGVPADLDTLVTVLGDNGGNPVYVAALKVLAGAIGAKVPPPARPPLTTPAEFIPKLLRPKVEQFRGAPQLPRSLSVAFQPNADVHPAMMIRFAPQLRDTLYTAWSNARIEEADSDLKAVYAFRIETPLFASGVSNMPTYVKDTHELNTQDLWKPWDLAIADSTRTMFLDQAHDTVAAGSLVLIDDKGSRKVLSPVGAQTLQRSAYGANGKATQLNFADDWRAKATTIDALRGVLVFAQSEEQTLAEEPIPELPVGSEIELDELYDGLTSGRWIVLQGERSDIEGVSGVTGTELLMVSGLRQDATIPGDATHTTLLLATKTAFSYKRNKNLKIYGNVVKATHGETKNETLGSGDGSQPLQAFALKQPPLTFVSAPNPSGVDSTLQVYVNNIQWHETDTLAGLGPKDRNFVTMTDDKDVTAVLFGNGVAGSRLPTGVQNIMGIYRNGIGKPGNVDPEQISMLVTRPLGVKAVINPLRASGGADRENIVNARANTPLAMMALDRLVSVDDYGFFARTFAGVGKAEARRLSNGSEVLVQVTIAGDDDVPIDTTSDLYRNLVLALSRFSGADVGLQVDVRELMILVTSAKIKIGPDYLWDDIVANVRAAILDQFGFAKRSLGQPALLCELIAAIQKVEGVVYVDVDAFGGIPEREPDKKGNRSLVDMASISKKVQQITDPKSGRQNQPAGVNPRVDVNQADLEKGVIRPAQLGIFTDAVPDTIVLNQIL